MATTTEPRPATLTPARSRAPGVLGLAGVFALAAGAALILLLQFIPPTSQISTIHRTISEYGLSANKWIFDAAVILVAGGSAVLFAVHILQRTLPAVSVATVSGALWTVSLLVIVAFPKTNWAVGPSAGGAIHRIASVIGFVFLPVGVLLAARRAFGRSPLWRTIAVILSITSLLWFGVILGAIALHIGGGGPWWQTIPLGLVERLMALNELLAVATLAVPLIRTR